MTYRNAAIVLALVAIHAAAVACAGLLPEAFGPGLAATVYLPLWPLSALGLPVFGTAPSGGWPAPNGFGWTVLLGVWAAGWSIAVGIVTRARRSPPKA